MVYGSYFEPVPVITGQGMEEIEQMVDGAIDFLAPYFNVTQGMLDDLETFQLPTVIIVESGNPFFRPLDNAIGLRDYMKGNNPSVGHEVGHWFHARINPTVGKSPHDYATGDLLRECIADYSKFLYMTRDTWSNDYPFYLPQLARFSMGEAETNREKIKKMHVHILRTITKIYTDAGMRG